MNRRTWIAGITATTLLAAPLLIDADYQIDKSLL